MQIRSQACCRPFYPDRDAVTKPGYGLPVITNVDLKVYRVACALADAGKREPIGEPSFDAIGRQMKGSVESRCRASDNAYIPFSSRTGSRNVHCLDRIGRAVRPEYWVDGFA